MDIQLKSVERDGSGVLGNVQVDDDGAFVCQLVKVGVDRQMVMARHHVHRQQLAALDRGRGRGIEASSGSTHGGAEARRGASSTCRRASSKRKSRRKETYPGSQEKAVTANEKKEREKKRQQQQQQQKAEE
ncbi:hypothetical protein Trco_001699 [Trichoderma cornu-damae]|uniref:Uncharacterized protein n=1 Tax=Trichoderma cornu-damae TaxID=654480 RepID=A0A9P8QTB3_9HYPO|nr:hypothetical protein Trco_001699 [Trichoderma cornu-damae]